MAPTHVLVGLLLAAPLAAVAPEFAPVVAVAAAAGSVAPDLDMVVGTHRRTLHFPVLAWPPALAAAAVALFAPGPWTVGAAVFCLAAAVHPLLDYLGGSSEPNPWLAESDRGVYDHHAGGWVAPRRLVPYDGSPGDLAVASLAAVPGLWIFGPRVQPLVVGCLAVGVGYAALRKRIPQLSGRVRLPGPLGVLVRLTSLFRLR